MNFIIPADYPIQIYNIPFFDGEVKIVTFDFNPWSSEHGDVTSTAGGTELNNVVTVTLDKIELKEITVSSTTETLKLFLNVGTETEDG